VVPAKGRNGKPHKVGWKVSELSARELVKRSPLVENGWTADRIGRIERMERHVTPMELGALEDALEKPGLFAEADPATRFVDAALRAGRPPREHGKSPSAVPPAGDASDAES
jgi:hypothetical protein